MYKDRAKKKPWESLTSLSDSPEPSRTVEGYTCQLYVSERQPLRDTFRLEVERNSNLNLLSPHPCKTSTNLPPPRLLQLALLYLIISLQRSFFFSLSLASFFIWNRFNIRGTRTTLCQHYGINLQESSWRMYFNFCVFCI